VSRTLALLALVVAWSAAAQPFRPGDILIDGGIIGQSGGALAVIRQGALPPSPLAQAPMAGFYRILVDPSGVAWVLRTDAILRIDALGHVLSTWPQSHSPRSSVFRADGTLVVSYHDGPFTVLDASGNTVQSVDASGDGAEIDLAADQCTLFQSGITVIHRYDLCQGTQLADIIPSPITLIGDLRLLPNDDILITTTVNVKRLSPTGTVLQTLPVEATALTLTRDAHSFWAVGGGFGGSHTPNAVRHVDLATGTVLETLDPAPYDVTNVGRAGEWRAALAGAVTAPALSPVAVLLLFFAVAATGLRRLDSPAGEVYQQTAA
jgi:hypothetical protein